MRVLEVLAVLGTAAVAALLLRSQVSTRRLTRTAPADTSLELAPPAAIGMRELDALVRSLPGVAVVLGRDEQVVYASPDTARLNLVRRGQLVFEELTAVARQSRLNQDIVVREMSLRRPPLRKGIVELRVRAIPMEQGRVLLLIDDLTEEHRVATVRRDFIANVSHELKTPVGAISLLSEALLSAADDPAAVQHFAARLHIEAGRLTNLINDVIDLSRLQGEDPMAGAQPVNVDSLVAEAVDHVQSATEAKHIEVVVGGTQGLQVLGMADQLVTAIRNLLTNAIAYSPEHTRVAVGVRLRDGTVEIAVKDQGIGIDPAELSRIFERFYRVDAARSRVTGGTGLGLAIVRAVCRNHGGDVQVWSVVDEGSTFTIQLPQHLPDEDPEPTPGQPQPITKGSPR